MEIPTTSPIPRPMGEREAYEQLKAHYGAGLARAVVKTYKRILKHGGYSHWDHVSDNYLEVGGDWNRDHMVALQRAGIAIPARDPDPGKEYYFWYSYMLAPRGPIAGTRVVQGPEGLTMEEAQEQAGRMITLAAPSFSNRKPWKQFNATE